MYHKIIKIRGTEGAMTGYFVPRMYQLVWSWNVVKAFGLPYIKERLNGWTIWWVDNEEDFARAVNTLNELKKTRWFDFKVVELEIRGS